MSHLTRSDYAGALRLLAPLEAQAGDPERFAQATIAAVSSFVACELKRRGLDFSERDRERLELLRPHLAFLYRQACAAAVSHATAAMRLVPPQTDPLPASLTPRETEVMHWLSCGKTNADIAAVLSISPRTVQKHLEHIYVKFGVETRTAAVMRARAANVGDDRQGCAATTRLSSKDFTASPS